MSNHYNQYSKNIHNIKLHNPTFNRSQQSQQPQLQNYKHAQNYKHTQNCLTGRNLFSTKGFVCSDKQFYNMREPHYINKFIDPNIESLNENNVMSIDNNREIKRENIATNDVLYRTLNRGESEAYKNQISIYDKITKINIDSRNRNISPLNIVGNRFKINNAFSISSNSNVLTIYHQNHNFQIEDKITIQNVVSDISQIENPIEITKGSKLIKIKQTHEFIEGYDRFSDIHIELSGIRGNTRNYSFIDNIPVSILNRSHKVIFKKDVSGVIDPNFYFIEIPITPLNNYTDGINNIGNTVKIKLLNLNGIPLSFINADFPVNINQRFGFHVVQNVIDSNSYQIELDAKASVSGDNLGGVNIIIGKIDGGINGYPNPNNYIIPLKKTFYNVIKIEMVTSEIPNSSFVIRSSGDRINNKIRWQNLEDGDFIYEANITRGNYTPDQLKEEIIKQIELVERNNVLDSNIPSNKVIKFHRAFIDINTSTNVINFKLFKENIIERPITYEPSSVSTDPDVFRIKHINHTLEVGDIIIIRNSLSTDGISSNIINSEHIISKIIDKDNYRIQLPKNNKISDTTKTGGGVSVSILTPLHFRLLFNSTDTIGDIIGFRSVGESHAITKFGTSISNDQQYDRDFASSVTGESDDVFKNKIINLSGDNYVLLTNSISDNSLDTGKTENLMAKILFIDPPGSISFNTHITMVSEFEKPISSLSQLEFKFIAPDGNLYDFNEVDHSFTIQITERTSNPTNVSSRTGNV